MGVRTGRGNALFPFLAGYSRQLPASSYNIMFMKIVCCHHVRMQTAYIKQNRYILKGTFSVHHALSTTSGIASHSSHCGNCYKWNEGEQISLWINLGGGYVLQGGVRGIQGVEVLQRAVHV